MFFEETFIEGVYVIEQEIKSDERGFFSRAFCANEFEKMGLSSKCLQASRSFSSLKGTLRGMHYQLEPHAETKLVQCTRGSLYDVALDLRENSPTFGKSVGRCLSDKNRKMMYIPKGCAHGFITLENDTEIFYIVSQFYDSKSERGVRWNDPLFQIEWPISPSVLSPKDLSYPDFLPTS